MPTLLLAFGSLLMPWSSTCSYAQTMLPVEVNDRRDVSTIRLTTIGKFGIPRKARKNIPAHLHTGIDIKRPRPNYENEPIFPVANGVVISKRDDGPYAQLIIEHSVNNRKFWTVYEHIAGISARVNDVVQPGKPIARFMNTSELNRYGWQFDHFHFEVLKEKPQPIVPGKNTPERFFNSYSLVCYSEKDLLRYFHDPKAFLQN
jgi:murein DD-endopeptidase MepM/ murein hydrolase activator NlpD